MNSIKIKPEHYNIISDWWAKQNWPIIPEDHLPKAGFIIYNLDTPVIAGFIYKTDSSFGLFEFIVANPEVKGLVRTLAFDLLIESVIQYSKESGIKSLFSSVTNKSLIKRLAASGFMVTDEGMTNLIRRI